MSVHKIVFIMCICYWHWNVQSKRKKMDVVKTEVNVIFRTRNSSSAIKWKRNNKIEKKLEPPPFRQCWWPGQFAIQWDNSFCYEIEIILTQFICAGFLLIYRNLPNTSLNRREKRLEWENKALTSIDCKSFLKWYWLPMLQPSAWLNPIRSVLLVFSKQ